MISQRILKDKERWLFSNTWLSIDSILAYYKMKEIAQEKVFIMLFAFHDLSLILYNLL